MAQYNDSSKLDMRAFSILRPIEQKTMTELVAQRLIALLSNGILSPGDKLPPERELAAQLNVGRSTVREALKLLTLSGLLEARRGDGTYVRDGFLSFVSQQIEWPALLNLHELDRVLEVRQPLEVQAARLAAERATPEEVAEIAVFKRLADLEGRDIELETDIDVTFHKAIAAAAHNDLLLSLMDSLWNILRQYIALSNQMTETPTVAEHQAVYEAIAAHDPSAAERAMNEHLAISKQVIVSSASRREKAPDSAAARRAQRAMQR